MTRYLQQSCGLALSPFLLTSKAPLSATCIQSVPSRGLIKSLNDQNNPAGTGFKLASKWLQIDLKLAFISLDCFLCALKHFKTKC